MSIFAAALVVLALPPTAPAAGFSARVVGVTDGDTLTVLAAGDRPVKVRLAGIDAVRRVI